MALKAISVLCLDDVVLIDVEEGPRSRSRRPRDLGQGGESLVGRTDDAIDHLRGAIDRDEDMRALAADDSDFDPIREEPVFKELIG